MEHHFHPINLQNWIDKNKHLLTPPICHKLVFEEKEAFVIVIGGPNNRKEFHYNEAPEFFFQLKGEMLLKIRDGSEVKNIIIQEGEMFLLPARVPHSPVRYENTVGIVVDMRHPKKGDGLQWYCPQCDILLYEEYFKVNDIETDFLPVYDRFFSNNSHYTCGECGYQVEREGAHSTNIQHSLVFKEELLTTKSLQM